MVVTRRVPPDDARRNPRHRLVVQQVHERVDEDQRAGVERGDRDPVDADELEPAPLDRPDERPRAPDSPHGVSADE
jgi:hypothetical protein